MFRLSASRSYTKTTIACALLALASTSTAWAAVRWLPRVPAWTTAAALLLVASIAAIFACAGILVLRRFSRDLRGARDLFLELNQSREPAALRASPPRSSSWLRRWLARRTLGHDLAVGEIVEVRPWPEIRATLDEDGCLDGMPFMPEMISLCGQRVRVFRCMHRLFDYRKTRRMRHMDGTVLLLDSVCDGADHGGCEAACHTIWKSAWLKRPDKIEGAGGPPALNGAHVGLRRAGSLSTLETTVRQRCQLTELHAASRPVGNWSVVNALRPLIAGNVTFSAFIVGWLTHLFNTAQLLRGGVAYPAFDAASPADTNRDGPPLTSGDRVTVRASGAIRATLNDRLMHRGLWFEPDMLKHCNHQYNVESVVTRLIDIVTGELILLKTPAYVLGDAHFSGERQLFNAQYEPLFWRSAWLDLVSRDVH